MHKKTLLLTLFTSLIIQSTAIAGGNEKPASANGGGWHPKKEVSAFVLGAHATAVLTGSTVAVVTGPIVAVGLIAYGAHQYYQSRQSPKENIEKN